MQVHALRKYEMEHRHARLVAGDELYGRVYKRNGYVFMETGNGISQ